MTYSNKITPRQHLLVLRDSEINREEVNIKDTENLKCYLIPVEEIP